MISYDLPEHLLTDVENLMEFCEHMADGARNTDDINYVYRVDCLKYADIAVELHQALERLKQKQLVPSPKPIFRRNRPKVRRKPVTL